MKRFLFSLFLCLTVFTALLPAGAFAAGGAVTLIPRQDSAGVTVTLGENADSGITSLRLSFQIQLTEGDAEKTRAQFSFAGSLPGSVHEYRYDAQTGRLNLYVAGRDALFTDGAVNLGSVVLSTEDAGGAAASVSVIEDSLELANAVYRSEKPGVDTPTVELAVGTETNTPAPDSSSSGSSPASESTPVSQSQTVTITASSSSQAVQQGASGGKKPVSSSDSESDASKEASSSVSLESSSVAPASSSTSSSSQSQTPQGSASSGNFVIYGVIVVLVAAILAAGIFFLRRK